MVRVIGHGVGIDRRGVRTVLAIEAAVPGAAGPVEGVVTVIGAGQGIVTIDVAIIAAADKVEGVVAKAKDRIAGYRAGSGDRDIARAACGNRDRIAVAIEDLVSVCIQLETTGHFVDAVSTRQCRQRGGCIIAACIDIEETIVIVVIVAEPVMIGIEGGNKGIKLTVDIVSCVKEPVGIVIKPAIAIANGNA